MTTDVTRQTILDAAALLGVIPPAGDTLEEAALTLMQIEDDHRWSMALWTTEATRDIRLAACARRRVAIDTLSQQLFGDR